MAKLNDHWFDAKFYGNVQPGTDGRGGSMTYLPSIEGAQGIMIWCPCGYGKPEFPLEGARPHAILVPFSNPRNAPLVPDDHGPVSRDKKTRPRWKMTGSGIEDLTVEPSVLVGTEDHECWHGHIINGEVR